MNNKTSVQPFVSFLAIVIFGIIFAVKINQNPNLKAPIILGSIIFGFIITLFELRLISRQPRQFTSNQTSPEDREQRLSKMVIEVFKEDFSDDDENK